MQEAHGTPGAAGISASILPRSPRPPRHRSRALIWILPIAIAALVLGGVTALQLTAWQGYDDARTSLNQARDEENAASREMRAALTGARSVSEATTAILAVPDGGLLDDGNRQTLVDATEQTASQRVAAEGLLHEERPDAGSRRFWFWDVRADTARLAQLTTTARSRTRDLGVSESALRTATAALRSTVGTALTAAAERAAAAEAANMPADNDAVLDVRTAVQQVMQRSSPFQPRVRDDYAALAEAVQRLQQSHAATLAAEAGPLEQSRRELEDFARSLAPGVLMDFEWADLINGLGESNGYLSGETSWWYDRGGYATIRLSNSIAQDWPSDAAHAIVAHEVGHAITVRCRAMYDTQDTAAAEAWATAWAISMGFTADANGTSAYGAPPDSMVQTAAGCR